MKDYGLDARLAECAAAYPGLTPGRIVAQERALYRAVFEGGERLAEVSGRLVHQAQSAEDFPCVGDFVMADTAPERAVIRAVLPRRSLLVRRAQGGRRRAFARMWTRCSCACSSITISMSAAWSATSPWPTTVAPARSCC